MKLFPSAFAALGDDFLAVQDCNNVIFTSVYRESDDVSESRFDSFRRLFVAQNTLFLAAKFLEDLI
jgi:hypothetical protein